MKAIIYEQYGSADVLKLAEVNKPVPQDEEVLIRVRAASVNSWDCDLVKGKSFLVRLAGGGILRPKIRILGCDIAGIVESAGSGVSDFNPGDEVFGDISACGWGGFAEYVCAKADLLAAKPAGLNFQQAASIPQAGVLALQALRHAGKISKGFKILINGAGGGVGTFGLQLAKMYGADVTCVDRGDKLDMLKALGADGVIDYNLTDITKTGNNYNLIIDNVASHSIKDYERVLSPGGKLVVVGGSTATILKVGIAGSWLPREGKKMSLLMHKPNRIDLENLSGLIKESKIKPVIDSSVPLEKTAYAVRMLCEGKVNGKIVVRV